MKDRYRLFLRRKSVYYAFDNTSKTFQSLKTNDKSEAKRLLNALNDAGRQAAMNLSLARIYLQHADPMVSQRTWQHVMDEIISLKAGATQYRWQTAANDEAFDNLRNRPLIEALQRSKITPQGVPRAACLSVVRWPRGPTGPRS